MYSVNFILRSAYVIWTEFCMNFLFSKKGVLKDKVLSSSCIPILKKVTKNCAFFLEVI